MDYPEERKQYIDGIACQYLCHIEKAEKPGNVFSAHFHYYIEMLYALSGHFRIYLNGIYHEFAGRGFCTDQFQGSAPDRRALIRGRLLYRGSFSPGTHLRRHDAEPL